jgi:hypothetical protein
MRQDTRMGAVVVAAATALSFVALSAMAQSAGDYTQVCQSINGRLACSSVARSSIGSGSTRPYEQWEDGSPARGSAASADDLRLIALTKKPRARCGRSLPPKPSVEPGWRMATKRRR